MSRLVTIEEYTKDDKAHLVLVTRNENGKREYTTVGIDTFKPYFYIPSVEGTLNTIDGSLAKKVEFDNYNLIKEARSKHETTYEADVHYTSRYLIDCIPNFEKVNLRIQYTDIEKDIRTNQIISIAVYDNYLKKCIAFVWRADLNQTHYNKDYSFPSGYNFKATVHTYNNRKSMLADYIQFINDTDPDILTGWYFIKFDAKEILQEIKEVGLNVNLLSPIGRAYLIGETVSKHDSNIAIKGRVLWDMLSAYKALQQSRLPSESLEAISQKELHEGKHAHKSFSEIWNNIDELVEYNCKDAVLVYRIDEKKKILNYFDNLRCFVGCNWTDLFHETLLWDVYLLRKMHNIMALPTKHAVEIGSFEGATVVQPPEKGIYKNILLTDFMRLYPSSIITFNMSPETVVRTKPDPEKHYILPNGIAFKKEPIGLLPKVLLELLEMRKSIKKQMKAKDTEGNSIYRVGSDEYDTLDNQQYAVKVLMNALYGAMGYFNFRLATPEVATSTTFVGRLALARKMKVLEKLGYKVIYGDTDSVFIKAKETELDMLIPELLGLVDTINAEISDYFENELGAKECYIETEAKSIYKNLIISEKKSGTGTAKKRYAGLRYWVEGQTLDINSDEALEIKGFESKRSDTSQLSRELQKQVFRLILVDASPEKIKKLIREYVNGIEKQKYPLEYIGISKGIKSFDSYKTDNPHRRGAMYSNHYLGTQFSAGDKPKVVYVSLTGKYPKTDVIAFNNDEEVPKDFKIDSKLMIEKTIIMKVEHILNAAGFTIEEILNNTRTIEDFF